MTTKADLSPERLRALLGRLQDSRPSAAAGLSTWLAHVEATRRSAKGSGIPAATPRRQGPLTLTIGMATHDDFDGAYFTVQAIRLFHPEVAEQTEILVVDNDPRGIAAEPLKRLESHIPGYRYVPFERWKATAVKDVVFREAAGTFVLCIDSHVLLAPGSLRKLLDYIDAHPDTSDLLQGPARHDNLRELMSHMEPVWRDAMFGTWAHDQRADDRGRRAFEIPMQGTGLFCCRRAAWPGFNARFVGFGGEEGYLHEKFRRRGDRTLCLPFLRWLHRFERPRGATYRNAMEDRVRNYVIGFSELGLDLQPVHSHFSERLGADAGRLLDAALADVRNSFHFFDAIYLVNLEHATERRREMALRFESLGIDWRVRQFAAVETPENPQIGRVLSHRTVIEEARRLGLRNVLVFEDDCMFLDDAPQLLGDATPDVERGQWSVLYLGARGRASASEPVRHLNRLVRPSGWASSHAVAYSERVYHRLLAAIPDTVDGVTRWLATERRLDQVPGGAPRRRGASDPAAADDGGLKPRAGRRDPARPLSLTKRDRQPS